MFMIIRAVILFTLSFPNRIEITSSWTNFACGLHTHAKPMQVGQTSVSVSLKGTFSRNRVLYSEGRQSQIKDI